MHGVVTKLEMRIVVVVSKRINGKRDEGLPSEKYNKRGTDEFG